MPKYKFILTLPNEVEIDSAEEIDGCVSWPNWSQADPVRSKGIFDSYAEAEKYASEFEIYKYIIEDMNYDSFECEEYGGYFFSIFDAEDAACRDLDIEPGEGITVHPEYTIEEVTEEDPENEIPAGVYKYTLHYDGEYLVDSIEEYAEYFDTADEAAEAAEEAAEEYDIDSGIIPYKLETIEILNIEIVEVDE